VHHSLYYADFSHHQIAIEKDKREMILSPQTFSSIMRVAYLPHLMFLRERDREKICKKMQKFRKKEWFDPRQVWLGAYFRTEIQTSQLPPVQIRWINEILGWGVFAQKDLQPLTYIGEYSGVVRKRARADFKNAYCFQYCIANGEDCGYNVDSLDRGGIVRFINHSNKPNLTSALANSQSLTHIILFTSRTVRKGEQLCYDYGPDYWKKRNPPIVP
jgi:hypothetical protein